MFRFLVQELRPDVVMDVGSRNGHDSLSFKEHCPQARVVAFEANPELNQKMQDDSRLRKWGIEVFPFAASNQDGEAEFTLFNPTKRTGSLLARVAGDGFTSYKVPARRLDGVL